MRYNLLLFLFTCVILLGGCAVLDFLCGTNYKGEVTGPAPIGIVGTILGSWIPGAAAVGTGIAGVWAAIRGKNYKAALQESAKVIEALDNKEVKTGIAQALSAVGLKSLADKAIAKVGAGPLAE